ncbi:hypothetical protein CVT25_013403 [Psilocybe cyanescens]|uniref:Rhodopsin domain-containing protein n=1 Tax=Psilocybe cyanescens TaxID=93625 RepID=A0A409WSR1_PSICY|nr:hypothetical protein CVT25_013403 [Psilocybe cyanescens]
MDAFEGDGPAQIPMKLPSSVFLPHRSYLGWKIAVTLFHLISSSSTVYRLVHRYRIRRLWWDDYILLGALVLDFVYWPIYWARATRAAMALAFARIFPPRHPARRWAFTLVAFMVLAGLATLFFTTLTCKAASALLVTAEMTHCMIAFRYVPLKHVLFFLDDLVCDSLLIIMPLVIFWRVKLPPTERRLILIFFCGSVLPMLGSTAYLIIANRRTVFSLGPDRPLVNLGLGAVNVSMGFMSCNLVVLSTCFYRALNRYRDRQRTAVVQNPNPNPVAPAPEPLVAECNCMTSDHIIPLSLTEISTTYTTWRSNPSRSRQDTDLHDMQDSLHPIVVTLFHLMSSSSTVYRLVHRYRIRRLWWDDYILLGALVLDFVYWPIYWARATRAAMALAFARIFPPRHAARRWAFTLLIFMVLSGLATLFFTTLTCKAASALLVTAEMTHCMMVFRYVPLKHVLFFLDNFVCNILLIIMTLVIFWRIKLPPTERRLILIFFCGSVLPLLGSTAYLIIANRRTVFSLGPDRPLVNLGLGAVNVSMGFMSCNLAVLSTCFYRALNRYRDRQRTAVVQNQNPNPVAPAPEPLVAECNCMTSDHITPLSLTEISTTYAAWRSNSSRKRLDTDLHDMLDTFHPSDVADSTVGSSARKYNTSSWSFLTNSSKSQKSKLSPSDLEDSEEFDLTSFGATSYESESVKEQSSSAGSSGKRSNGPTSSPEQSSSDTQSQSHSSAS